MPAFSSTVALTVSRRPARSGSAEVPSTATGSVCRLGAGKAPSPNTSRTDRSRQTWITASVNACQRRSGSGPVSRTTSRSPALPTDSSIGVQVTRSMVPKARRTTGRLAR
jgi:hypothetical protein